MADERTFVIVGAGLAGAKAARRCATRGSRGSVVMLGRAPPPYGRRRSPRACCNGGPGRDRLRAHADWYAGNDVELRTDTR